MYLANSLLQNFLLKPNMPSERTYTCYAPIRLPRSLLCHYLLPVCLELRQIIHIQTPALVMTGGIRFISMTMSWNLVM